MEKEERVASPLGAPHLGMDFFPVFDSRLDDSPKFRAQLQHWADRSKKVQLQQQMGLSYPVATNGRMACDTS